MTGLPFTKSSRPLTATLLKPIFTCESSTITPSGLISSMRKVYRSGLSADQARTLGIVVSRAIRPGDGWRSCSNAAAVFSGILPLQNSPKKCFLLASRSSSEISVQIGGTWFFSVLEVDALFTLGSSSIDVRKV